MSIKNHRKILFFVAILLFILPMISVSPKIVQAKPFLDATPNISVGVSSSEVMIGENFTVTVNFSNTGDAPGYGPFIDVVFPTNGADGFAGSDTPDGVFYNAALGAEYSGLSLDCESFTFDSSGEVVHPYYRDTTGNYQIIQGTTGDTFVSCLLPFGSFVPEQPIAPVIFNASLSNLADLGTPLPIRARGGFIFGGDPLDNWCCDVIPPFPASLDANSWEGSARADVTPSILTLAKTYSGPENETATGPNFQRTFTITVDIASDQTITELDVSDLLPDNMQYVGNVVALVHGAPVSPTDISTPSTVTPGGTLTRRFTSITGQTGDDISLSFDFYIPRDDSGSARVINPATGNDVSSPNEASALGDWIPIDGRDTTSSPPDNVSADVPGPEYILTDKSIAIQKGHTNTTDSINSPGDILQYTYTIQVSDFFAFEDLEITDLILDGQHFNSSFVPTMQVNGNGFTLGSAAINAANYTVDESEIGYTGPGIIDDGTDGSTTF